jgi:hypothetical protein
VLHGFEGYGAAVGDELAHPAPHAHAGL